MSLSSRLWDMAWCEYSATDHKMSGPVHLARDDGWKDRANDNTACGKHVEDWWVSRPPGLFFKGKVLKPRYGELCQDCLRISGGRGPIARKR